MDRKRHRIITFLITIVVVALCGIIIVVCVAIKNQLEAEIDNSTNRDDGTTAAVTDPPTESTVPDDNIIVEAKFINLQSVIDEWVDTLSYGEDAGIMIYDINNSRTAASYNANKVFGVASIYKLLFAYDGYKQISLGADSPETFIVSTVDKGDLNLSQCLDLIIRESYNPCADVLNADSNRVSRVSDLIRTLEMTNTTNMGLESTAADLTKLLRHFWRHTELTNQLWLQFADSMLNQPITYSDTGAYYDWRQGLPAGFNDKVNVYDKVGWEQNINGRWNIYADAAIVDFTEYNHYYTVVILTSNLSDSSKITRLGQMIEDAVITASDGIVK